MKLNKIMIAVFASIAIFATSCGSDNKKVDGAQEPTEGDGHHHTEVVESKAATKKMNLYENEFGQALDKNGNLITGCPSHTEMIGIEGDKCPKYGYMTMIPITWPLEGVDTVRVTSIADYNPPVDKGEK
jgi:hypothetical protein